MVIRPLESICASDSPRNIRFTLFVSNNSIYPTFPHIIPLFLSKCTVFVRNRGFCPFASIWYDFIFLKNKDFHMPTFDIVSELNEHELTNAIDQANREVSTRFDFKGTNSKYICEKEMIKIATESDFQLKQMVDVLHTKLTKRGIDLRHLDPKEPVIQLKSATQEINMKKGIETEIAKKMVKFIKDSKLKVQASIQGDQVRVTGKKRDDLQDAIALLRESKFGIPLQFVNFRD